MLSNTESIYIPIIHNESKETQHFIIELQGTIEYDPTKQYLYRSQTDSCEHVSIFLTWKDEITPILHIGQQLLYGTREKLKKPLVLTKKCYRKNENGIDIRELVFIQSINEKLVFKQRPRHKIDLE